jgi:uncharacterized membrane protein HdeD (DUF308 family)
MRLLGVALILAGVLLFVSIPNHWLELLSAIGLALLTYGSYQTRRQMRRE